MAKSDLNTVTLVGRLTADPTQDYLPNGTAKTTFSLANNYFVPNKDDQVSFFDIVCFGKLAETCATYLRKGKQIAIQGELRQSRWQSKEGQNRSKVEIMLRNMQMLGSPGDTGGGGGGGYNSPQPQNARPQQNAPAPQSFDEPVPDDFGDDEVPF